MLTVGEAQSVGGDFSSTRTGNMISNAGRKARGPLWSKLKTSKHGGPELKHNNLFIN